MQCVFGRARVSSLCSSTRVQSQALSTQHRHSHCFKRRVVSACAQADDDREQSPGVAGKPVAKTVSIRPRQPAPAPAETTTEVEDTNGSHTSEQHNRDNHDYLQNVNRPASSSGVADLFASTEVALICGDSWVVATTFLTSSLFPQSDVKVATAAVVICWVLTGLVRGDYNCEGDDDAAWVPGWTVYTGIMAACFTWLFSTPLVLLAYSVLVSQGWVDADPIMVIVEGSKVSPALAIQVALLIVMTAWRGLYYAFRDGVI